MPNTSPTVNNWPVNFNFFFQTRQQSSLVRPTIGFLSHPDTFSFLPFFPKSPSALAQPISLSNQLGNQGPVLICGGIDLELAWNPPRLQLSTEYFMWFSSSLLFFPLSLCVPRYSCRLVSLLMSHLTMSG